MNPYRDISDDEWQSIAPLLPELRPRSELRGRPLANTRSVLNGVLWVMFSGATWSAMPRKYPSYQTCHRRFKAWYESGVLKRVMEQLFGEASVELCSLMEARMRTHVAVEQKSVDAEKAPVAAPAVFSLPPAKPLPSSPFAFNSPFKNAA
ncbi:transposase [Paraburkholderia ginsengiterrae]|uniref:Transposase n=1 Tax=Paraburkholderia ginsengiterrae TaxID=1462993 RepID=A0A1A9N0K2_9BURK|nr:transposase [Paraburkholderia ginsengiterrae]OAJ54386.1 transposase [Paraburkholderia ginsengiterrae]OAJ56194.1 transposase [Paraburkholderia ginsengiterrae]